MARFLCATGKGHRPVVSIDCAGWPAGSATCSHTIGRLYTSKYVEYLTGEHTDVSSHTPPISISTLRSHMIRSLAVEKSGSSHCSFSTAGVCIMCGLGPLLGLASC